MMLDIFLACVVRTRASFFSLFTASVLLLGDAYARNLGLNIQRARTLVILSSGILVGALRHRPEQCAVWH